MEKRRILIVDNNDELRASLEKVLRELGHEVVATGDRNEALEREDLDEFDLIISDLTEDEHSGIQLLSEIKRKRLLIPVVVSSEEAQHPGVVKAFKMGAASQIPLRRVGQPADIASVIAFLCSDESGFVSGQTIYARGGP